jgi:hypothetical protein
MLTTRVFARQCVLAENSSKYAASVVVADGKCDAESDGVQLYDSGKLVSRLRRITSGVFNLCVNASALKGLLNHCCDPEFSLTADPRKAACEKRVI